MNYTRAEHLSWCKKRALQYVDIGDINQAFASLQSDLNKEECTRDCADVMKLGFKMLWNGQLDTPKQMREFMEWLN